MNQTRLRSIIKESLNHVINEYNIPGTPYDSEKDTVINWMGCDNIYMKWNGTLENSVLFANGFELPVKKVMDWIEDYNDIDPSMIEDFVKNNEDKIIQFIEEKQPNPDKMFNEWINYQDKQYPYSDLVEFTKEAWQLLTSDKKMILVNKYDLSWWTEEEH